jgi:FAD/FMN-containing dehydrogenase
MPTPSLLQRLKERKLVQWVGLVLVAAVLLLTGLMGIRSSVSDLSDSDTLGKMVYTVFLGAGGCLGIAAGVAVLARSPRARALILGWIATIFVCLILTPFVWPWPGIVPMLGAFIVWTILTFLTYRGWQAIASSQPD